MKSMIVFALFAVVALVVDAFAPGAGPLALTALAPWPVIAKSRNELEEQATPQSGGLSEAIPWVFYDTETYVDATTLSLTFFRTVKNDPALSNMQTAGVLPEPQFFELFGIGCDIQVPPGAAAWADMWNLIFQDGGGYASLFLADKDYGPTPLSFLHQSGGVQGFSDAAAAATQNANNSFPDGGFPWQGALTIQPQTNFRVKVDWPSAVDLAADVNIRLFLYGTLHRKVL